MDSVHNPVDAEVIERVRRQIADAEALGIEVSIVCDRCGLPVEIVDDGPRHVYPADAVFCGLVMPR